MLPHPEPKRGRFSGLMADSPPQPDLMFFVMIKAPRFVRFSANGAVFAGFKVLFVYIFCLVLFFFNSFITVSALIPNLRAVARIPAPSTARLMMALFTSDLHPL
jgi:hypothetical protein